MASLKPPTTSSFPSHINLTITPPPASTSSNRPPRSILILLHGLGDTHTSLTPLARQLSLPSTLVICLRAPHPLPFDLGGFHWGDDVQFHDGEGGVEYDAGFNRAVKYVLDDVIEEILAKECGYGARDVVIMGLGQGGMAGLAVAAEMARRSQVDEDGKEGELGGVISLGGVMPESYAGDKGSKVGAPVLVCGGERATGVTKTGLARTKAVCQNVEYVMWKRSGDGMARDREEMWPIMRFLARRLKSWEGVPEGAVEVG